jgi:hypothetical protein
MATKTKPDTSTLEQATDTDIDGSAGALAQVEKTAGALPPAPIEGIDLEADAGVGSENISKDDMAMPFFKVLQDLSPQTKRSKAEYIEGAAPGMFFNTVTRRLYPGNPGVIVIGCHYARTFIEWVTREKGGGFVADLGLAKGQLAKQQAKPDDRGRLILPSGNQLVETAYQFMLLVDGEWQGEEFQATGTADGILFTMSSTFLRPSRHLNTLVQGIKLPGRNGMFTPARPYMSFRMFLKEVSNDQGTWSIPDFEPYKPTPQLPNGAALYRQGLEFAKLMSATPLPVDVSEQGEGVVDGEGAGVGVSEHF